VVSWKVTSLDFDDAALCGMMLDFESQLRGESGEEMELFQGFLGVFHDELVCRSACETLGGDTLHLAMEDWSETVRFYVTVL